RSAPAVRFQSPGIVAATRPSTRPVAGSPQADLSAGTVQPSLRRSLRDAGPVRVGWRGPSAGRTEAYPPGAGPTRPVAWGGRTAWVGSRPLRARAPAPRSRESQSTR